jgi:hypothetical protein
MAEPRFTYIADEEDGPAVAVCIDFSDGRQVWSGEVSRVLLSEQGEDDREALGDDLGSFVVLAEPGDGARVLARAVDRYAAMEMATAYAEWLWKHSATANAEPA